MSAFNNKLLLLRNTPEIALILLFYVRDASHFRFTRLLSLRCNFTTSSKTWGVIMQEVFFPYFVAFVAALIFITYLDVSSGGNIFLWLVQ